MYKHRNEEDRERRLKGVLCAKCSFNKCEKCGKIIAETIQAQKPRILHR